MGCSGSKSGDVQEPKPAEGGEGGDAAAAQKQEVEQNGSTPAGEFTPQKIIIWPFLEFSFLEQKWTTRVDSRGQA